MDNPLEQPAPDDPIKRVKAFAIDLAWGVAHGMWGIGFRVARLAGEERWLSLTPGHEASVRLHKLLNRKWRSKPPESNLLRFNGYLERDYVTKHVENQPAFLLTPEALELLEKYEPTNTLKVFIAYKRSESTGLASFLEEGIQNSDLNIEVFTDKKIPLGDRWEKRLEQSVRECDVFICLFSMKTLESEYVRDEIEWALDSDCRFIPILHNGYKGEGDYAELLRKLQGPPVFEESVKAYEFTLIDLLRTLRNIAPRDEV